MNYPVGMEINREYPLDAEVRLIRSYAPGQIVVDRDTFTQSFALAGSRLDPEWPPATIEELSKAHLDALLAFDPEVVLLGTGRRMQHPGMELMGHVMRQGIGLEVMDTGSACRTYNILAGEGRRVVAGLMMIEND